MRKLVALLVAVFSVFTLCFTAGCKKEIKIKEGGTVVVGITDYKPMDYLDTDNVWKGFDYELAQKTFAELGYEVEFKVIDWETKTISLNAGDIDCIWNGMTVTDELKENLKLSDVYLKNQQYGLVKVKNKDKYTNKDSLVGAKVAVEGGSAAEGVVEGIELAELNKQSNQNAAVLEVASGASDVAIVDYTLAKTITAEGTDYAGKLVMVDLGFAPEEFAIGFRKSDADVCAKVNEQIAKFREDNTINSLAEKYGITNLLVTD